MFLVCDTNNKNIKMVIVSEQLNKVLRGVHLCVLCLQDLQGNAINMNDVTYMEKNVVMPVSELVSFILGCEFQVDTMDNMSTVCEKCIKLAISCHTFMEGCRSAHAQLLTLVDNLAISLPNDCPAAKSMCIALHSDLTSKIYVVPKNNVKDKVDLLKTLKLLGRQNIRKKKKVKSDGDVRKLLSAKVKSSDKPKFSCKDCDKIFPTQARLKCHYLKVHAERTIQCPNCEKKFATQSLLNSHHANYHVKSICSSCGKIYKNLPALQRHMESHNISICPTCGKQYKDRKYYRKHLARQSCGVREYKYDKDQKFICDMCDKRFNHKVSLRQHISFVHGNDKSYDCPWCDRKYPYQSYLNTHIIKHTGERKFTCETCGGKFVSKAALVYHTRLHTGEKPFPCPECDLWFISTSRRVEHLRRTHWAPTRQCDLCPSIFKKGATLNKHRERHFDPNSKLYCQELSKSIISESNKTKFDINGT